MTSRAYEWGKGWEAHRKGESSPSSLSEMYIKGWMEREKMKIKSKENGTTVLDEFIEYQVELLRRRLNSGPYRTTKCPKIGASQWTCTKDECICHFKEKING